MRQQMMTGVTKIIRNLLSFLLLVLIIIGCNRREKIYLDYKEVVNRDVSNKNTLIGSNEIILYNKNDSVILRKIINDTDFFLNNNLMRKEITPVDTVIKMFGNMTFDSVTKEREFPQIFIVRKDTLKNKHEIIKTELLFKISNHKPGYLN